MANANSKLIDLTGQRIHRLTVLKEVDSVYRPQPRRGRPNNIQRIRKWLCLCECGNEKVIQQTHLVQQVIKSCGCLNRENCITRNRTHGQSGTPMYTNWVGILARCTNPNHNRYKYYGKKGITICQGWRDFAHFAQDMGERPSPQHTIDRRDNAKGYWCGHCDECVEKHQIANCRWATILEQANNKTSTRFYTYQNQTLSLAEWARKINLSWSTLYQRLKRGWSIEQTLSTPYLR